MMQISRELRGKVYGLNAFASRESVTRHFQDSETWRTVKILVFHVSLTKDIFVTHIGSTSHIHDILLGSHYLHN